MASDSAETRSITPAALLDCPQDNHGGLKHRDEMRDSVDMPDAVLEPCYATVNEPRGSLEDHVSEPLTSDIKGNKSHVFRSLIHLLEKIMPHRNPFQLMSRYRCVATFSASLFQRSPEHVDAPLNFLLNAAAQTRKEFGDWYLKYNLVS
jgi:hypothetical protein